MQVEHIHKFVMYLSMLCLTILLWALDGIISQEGAPIVGNLITSDCIVKLYVSNPQSCLRGLDYRIFPTIGAIDALISQISTLPHCM